MRNRALFTAVLMALLYQTARAERLSVVVGESAFNKVAAAVGAKSGDAGKFKVSRDHPCFPDVTRTCTTVFVPETKLSWEVSAVKFRLTRDGGVTIEGNVTGTFGALTASATVSTTGSVTYDEGSSELRVVVIPVSTKLSFQIERFGRWDSPDIPLPLPDYGFSIPLTTTALPLRLPSAGMSRVRMRLRNPTLEVRDGALKIDAEVTLW